MTSSEFKIAYRYNRMINNGRVVDAVNELQKHVTDDAAKAADRAIAERNHGEWVPMAKIWLHQRKNLRAFGFAL